MKATPILIIAFSALVIQANAQVLKSAKGYTIRPKYQKGQIIRQRLTMSVSQAGAGNSSLDFTMKVLSVDSKGVATVDMTAKGFAGPTKTPINQRSKFKVDRNGKTVGPETNYAGSFSWPNTPVKPGETWTGDATYSGMAVKARYKFIGMTNIGGKSVAEISSTMSMSGQVRMSGTGTFYIRASDGQNHSSKITMNMSAPDNRGTIQTSKILMSIVSI